MFSLIITIISIALVAALALATLYYGGDAFNQGKAGAEASRLINEGQQLNAAVTLAKATGVAYSDWDSLVTGNLLSQVPSVFALTGSDTVGNVELAGIGDDVCVEVQKRASGATTLAIGDIDATKQTGQVYGCFVDGTNGNTFFYNVE